MKVAFVAALALLCVSCATTPEQSVASKPATPHSELVFLGTVTNIQQGLTGDFYKRFVVTTRVDKVLSGSFSGKQFQFAVHSPAQSGLDIGKQYTIRATRTESGYLVDDLQWLLPATKTR
jgi:hypothetical protein